MLHHSPCSGIEFSSNQLHKYIRTERPRELKSVASQTVGLFFPSQKKIDQMEKDFEEKLAFEKQMRDRRPMLTAVSPGKGNYITLSIIVVSAAVVVVVNHSRRLRIFLFDLRWPLS